MALSGLPALACGHCVEDKIAAVYDYATVMRAHAQKHHIAFFAINGPLALDAGTRRAIQARAESAHGVDKGSARVSVEAAALSVAYDPQRVPLSVVQKALEQTLTAKKLSLSILQVMAGPSRPPSSVTKVD